MTDVFFSYSSKDRERVRPIRDALVAEGFDVFWDQDVPPGRNWDEWIRQHLDAARCAVVFWSAHSVKLDNVVHGAAIAQNAGKLIPVLLDPIEENQFPTGHSTAACFSLLAGDTFSANLSSVLKEVELRTGRRKRAGFEALPTYGNQTTPDLTTKILLIIFSSAWYILRTVLLLYLTAIQAFYLYVFIAAAYLTSDPSLRQFALIRGAVSALVLIVCSHFWRNRIRGG